MPTAILALTNDYAALNVLPAADVNALADALEWVAAGYLSKSIAGSTTPVTLAEAEYEVSVLKLTGVITANIAVEVPAHAGRRWLVQNATTGAFTVTVKTAAGTGIAILQGTAALLFGDGTDILRANSPAAAVADSAGAPSAGYVQAEAAAVLAELRALKSALEAAGLLTP